MFFKKVITTVMLLSIIIPLFAASIFSPNGFVEEHFGCDTFGAGMGYTGISSLFRRNFSVINPALLTTVSKANFSTQIDFGYTTFKDKDDSYTNKVSNLPYATMYVPLNKTTILGLSFLQKYYYSLSTAFEDSIELSGKYLVKDEKIGSLNELGFNIAKKIGKFGIGLKLNYIFSNRTEDLFVNYTDGDLIDTREIKENLLDGVNISAGFIFPYKKFSFGGFIQTKARLHSENTYKIEYYNNSNYDYKSFSTSKYDIPMQMGLGIGMEMTKYLYAETNFRYSFWKDTNIETMNGRNTSMISFGLSYAPQKDFYWKVPTRIGGYYRQLSCRNGGNYIDEKAITAGFGIPTMILNQGRLSISLAYGIRGSIDKNIYQDEFFRISFGFSSTDWWRNPKNYSKDKEIPKLDPKYKEYWN
ncbi:MAG: hypothetical protein JW794_00760 [Candidatus Cloacimonetes bacterium]|nr:hypothetical protein [Candidatus Cloacimonadota bacterium]